MVGMCRFIIYFLASYIRENNLFIFLIVLYQLMHFCKRTRNSFLVSIVKCEAHSKNNTTLKALSLVGLERRWILVSSRMEKKCRDFFDSAPIELTKGRMIAFLNIENTHNYSRKSRPFEPTMSKVDSSAMITYPTETSRSGVTLSNGVRSNQAKGSFIPNEIE